MVIQTDYKLKSLVNFKKNLSVPIHRWFNIKEGYSNELVQNYISKNKISEGFIIDFFSGSGTTALTAKQNKLKYFGTEVNPFLFLLSKVKLYDYSITDIKSLIYLRKNLLIKKKNIKQYDLKLSIAKKVFDLNYEKMKYVRDNILNIKETKYKDFFIVVLCGIIEKIGVAKKDGNGLKYPKNKMPEDFHVCFNNQFQLMIKDIQNNKFYNQAGSEIIKHDCRNLNQKIKEKIKNKTSLIIFSPPYANCFDYSEVYKLELWVSNQIKEYDNLKKIRNNSLSSHLNKILKTDTCMDIIDKEISLLNTKKLWSKKIIFMIKNYFLEMENILKNCHEILNKNGKCVIVVGNSAYAGTVIKTDEIFCTIAKKIGFKNIEINIARKLRSSSQQSKILGEKNALRESIVILKK